MSARRVLVPVAQSSTVRETVEYAVDRVLADSTPDEPGLVRFVFVHSPEAIEVPTGRSPAWEQSREAADELLGLVDDWVREDAGDDADALVVETGEVGADEYLFSPDDVARALGRDAADHGIDRVVLDPKYDPGAGAPFLRPLEVELARDPRLTVEEAPVQRPVRRGPLLVRSTPLRFGALFGLSFVFYQVLAGGFAPFDLVTGAVSATIVAVALSRVTFNRDPDLRTPVRLARMALYSPYLLYEILVANVQVAAVILHPRLPIDPRMTRIKPAVWGALPVTTLANSITLTPGTLTVRVQGEQLLVHTLLPTAREGLFDGGLERAVRFVFYGRGAVGIETPGDRGDAEVVQTPPGERDDLAADGGSSAGDHPGAVGGGDASGVADSDGGDRA